MSFAGVSNRVIALRRNILSIVKHL